MDDQLTLAFEFAADLSKQLITVSTGLLALSITFVKDIVKKLGKGGSALLFFAWLLFLLSVVAGFLHLAALTGGLAPIGGGAPAIPESARRFMKWQQLAFGFGMLALVLYGAVALRKGSADGGTGGAKAGGAEAGDNPE